MSGLTEIPTLRRLRNAFRRFTRWLRPASSGGIATWHQLMDHQVEEIRQLSGVNEALIGALARGEPFGQVAEEHRNPAIDATIARDSKYLQTVEKRNADATVRCYENALLPAPPSTEFDPRSPIFGPRARFDDKDFGIIDGPVSVFDVRKDVHKEFRIGIEAAKAYAENVEETKRERRELDHIRKSEVQKTRELHPLEAKEAATIREINERNASYDPKFQNRWNEYDKNAITAGNLTFGKDAENVFVRAPFDFKNHKPDECQIAGYCEVCAKQIPADSPRAIAMRKAAEEYGVAYIESHDPIPDAPLGILSAHERGEHQPALIDVRVGLLDLGIEKVSPPRVIFPQSLIATQFVAFRCGCTAVLLSDLGEKWHVATTCPCDLHAMKPSPFRGFDFGIKDVPPPRTQFGWDHTRIQFRCGCNRLADRRADLANQDWDVSTVGYLCNEHPR